MAQGMADAAAAIDRRQPFTDPSAGGVRVAAGEWSARFLAPRLGSLAEAQADLVVELLETNVPPDLGRREADVFIRHGLPARGHLVSVRLGVMAAAIYGSAPLVAAQPAARTEARWQACPWVAYDTPREYFGSMAWLAGRLAGRRPRVRASQFALQLEAIRAGSGLGILPCFIGDADPGLIRVTAPIEDLAHELWLLVRPDLKTAPRVRAVIEWTRSNLQTGPTRARRAWREAPVRAQVPGERERRRPATARTLRGAASQIATPEITLHAIAIQNASV